MKCHKCERELNPVTDKYCCGRIHFLDVESRGRVVLKSNKAKVLQTIIYEVEKEKPKKKRKRKNIPKYVKEYVKKRDKGKCTVCGCKNKVHIHHIVHVEDGGTNEPDNLKLLCDLCHLGEHENEPVYNLMIKSFWEYETFD